MGQSLPPLSPQSQPLNKTDSETADSKGHATFAFENMSPPQGFTWTGTLTCPAAPTNAQFMISVGGTSWGSFAGNSIFGPIQAQANQQVQIVATGLTAGIDYVMQWNGSSDPAALVAAVWPDPNTSSLEASISGSGLAGAGFLSFEVNNIAPNVIGTLAIFVPGPFRFWSWGIKRPTLAGTYPTTGTFELLFLPAAGGAAEDAVSLYEPGSNRLSGLTCAANTEWELINFFDQTVSFYANYSPL